MSLRVPNRRFGFLARILRLNPVVKETGALDLFACVVFSSRISDFFKHSFCVKPYVPRGAGSVVRVWTTFDRMSKSLSIGTRFGIRTEVSEDGDCVLSESVTTGARILGHGEIFCPRYAHRLHMTLLEGPMFQGEIRREDRLEDGALDRGNKEEVCTADRYASWRYGRYSSQSVWRLSTKMTNWVTIVFIARSTMPSDGVESRSSCFRDS